MALVRRFKTLGIFSIGFSVVLYVCFCLFVSGVTTNEIFAYGSILTNTEMASTFGDGTCPCKKTYDCDQGFKSGSSNCAYCDSSLYDHTRCCDLGNTDDCTYGTQSACSESSVYSGPISGSAGTCGTCTSTSYTKGGKCSLKNATGTSCP